MTMARVVDGRIQEGWNTYDFLAHVPAARHRASGAVCCTGAVDRRDAVHAQAAVPHRRDRSRDLSRGRIALVTLCLAAAVVAAAAAAARRAAVAVPLLVSTAWLEEHLQDPDVVVLWTDQGAHDEALIAGARAVPHESLMTMQGGHSLAADRRSGQGAAEGRRLQRVARRHLRRAALGRLALLRARLPGPHARVDARRRHHQVAIRGPADCPDAGGAAAGHVHAGAAPAGAAPAPTTCRHGLKAGGAVLLDARSSTEYDGGPHSRREAPHLAATSSPIPASRCSRAGRSWPSCSARPAPRPGRRRHLLPDRPALERALLRRPATPASTRATTSGRGATGRRAGCRSKAADRDAMAVDPASMLRAIKLAAHGRVGGARRRHPRDSGARLAEPLHRGRGAHGHHARRGRGARGQRMRCPLTDLAARYTDDRRANFDIYLPLWLAANNKRIFGSVFVARARGRRGPLAGRGSVTWALVLGGGGTSGLAWQTGLLAGLRAGGSDVTRPDLIVGTSAGAIAAARVACGLPLDAAFEREREPAPASRRDTAGLLRAVDELRRDLAGAEAWPDRPLQITALEVEHRRARGMDARRGRAARGRRRVELRRPVAAPSADDQRPRYATPGRSRRRTRSWRSVIGWSS